MVGACGFILLFSVLQGMFGNFSNEKEKRKSPHGKIYCQSGCLWTVSRSWLWLLEASPMGLFQASPCRSVALEPGEPLLSRDVWGQVLNTGQGLTGARAAVMARPPGPVDGRGQSPALLSGDWVTIHFCVQNRHVDISQRFTPFLVVLSFRGSGF